MIPKIIHHIWMGNKEIPQNNIFCINTIKELHKDFEYKLWIDKDIDELMKNDFPDYYDEFNKLPRMIMKIDMFRYFLMYKFGGLYTDVDYYMFKSFDLLENQVVIPCNREFEDKTPECLGNCFFASIPNHSFWKSLMDTLFSIDRTTIDYQIDKTIDGNILGTGPAFVYNMWKNYNEKNTIYIPERKFFHPLTKLNKEYIEELKQNKETYGMHICTGLWRNNNL